MSKFVIECPNCGKYAEAKKGFFARKKIDCACGYTIDVRTDRLASRRCPHCGNDVVFDQSKGAKAKCPVCHEPINTVAEQKNMIEFSCAQCGIRLSTVKGADTYTCPVCDCVNKVSERLKTEEIKKDGLASIIKYEGDGDSFIWKHPIEDFNLGSQLIVHESQEAVFFRDGQALDLFGPGRYTLETQQLPVLEKLYKLPTDTEGTFHSEVYFINKTVQMAVKWGTPDKVRFIDPLTGVPLEIGASGEMNLMVKDSRKLLIKLVGTMKGIAWGDANGYAKSLQTSFRPMIVQAVKSNLAASIKKSAYDLLEIDEHLPELADTLKQAIMPEFEEYGLTVPELYLTSLLLPEDDKNFESIRALHTVELQKRMFSAKTEVERAQQESEAAIEEARREAELQRQQTEIEIARRQAEKKIIEAQAEAQAMRMSGLTEAEIMKAKGYNEKDVLQSEVQKAYAEGLGNMGANGGGGAVGDIAGLGVALGAMGGVMGITKEAVSPMFNNGSSAPAPSGWSCPECGKTGITSKFCPDCGYRKPGEDSGWTCPECGKTGITSKFCPECGCKKPDTEWTCPECGKTGIKTKFCPECGHKKEN